LWGKGKDKIQAALERLDRLTNVAQTLGVVHGIADNMRVVMGGAPYFRAFSQILV
jgi:arginine utilization protein RocB